MRAREKSLLMGEKVLVNSHAESKKKYLLIKRILDIILGYIGIVVASPIFLLIILVIRIIDGSGTIYKQIRIGRYGKEFYMYKFRTMKKGCNSLKLELTSQEYENYKENYKLDNDRRVTKLGEVLRKSSLDELLQLLI